MRPAVEAAADAAFVKPGSPCTICGEPVRAGGMWMAADADLYICGRRCGEKLLLLALDTISDVEAWGSSDADRRACYRGWLRFAAAAFEQWEEADRARAGSP